MTSKTRYRSGKRRYYKSYKKRKSNEDMGDGVAILILLGGTLLIIGAIIQFIITYYYVVIILGLIALIIHLKFAKRRSNDPLDKNYSEYEGAVNRIYNVPEETVWNTNSSRNKIPTNKTHNTPIKSVLRTSFPFEENIPSEAYEGESFTRLENLKDYKLDSKIHINTHFEPDQTNESVKKGDEFERYVVDRFRDEFFSIVDWTTDMTRKHNRFVESECNPDLVIRHRESNEIFCVECKYRSRLVNGDFAWSYPDQMNRYFSFAQERQILFYVVLGLEGRPNSPAEVFCVPLEVAKNPKLPMHSIRKYYHDPREDFVWESGILR